MSHYSIGSDVFLHKGKSVRTTVGVEKADAFVERINTKEPSNYTKIPNGLEYRPDLLANQIYQDPDKLWLICLGSNRFDVFEDFVVGAQINLL